MPSATLYKLDEIPHDNQLHNGRMSRVGIRTEDVLVVIAELEPFDKLPPLHKHPYEQMVIGLDGHLRMQIGEEFFDVTAGTALVVPADTLHTGSAQGSKKAKFMEIFAPVRQDYAHLTKYQVETFKDSKGVDWFFNSDDDTVFQEWAKSKA